MSRYYIPLHCHNEYSLLDGMGKVSEWVSEAKRLGFGALGQTNHNSLMGYVKHYKECKKNDIKPVIGAEITVCDDIAKKDKESLQSNRDLLIFPRNYKQMKLLFALISKANEEGFYYKPRWDWAMLEQCAGMVVSTACRRGVGNKPLLKGDIKKARIEYSQLMDIFRSCNVYLEVQPHDDLEQQGLNVLIADMADHLHLPLVVGCDSHYPSPDDFDAHNILLLIQTYKKIEDAKSGKAMQFDRGYHLLSPKEVYLGLKKSLGKVTSLKAMGTTFEIAEKCEVELPLGQLHIPHYSENPERDFGKLLYHEWAMFMTTHGNSRDKDGHYVDRAVYEKRYNRERKVIEEMGLQDFFLIMNDIVTNCLDKDIKIRARGSVAGSLVAYLLKITDVDPIKFHLLFERFLNKSRTKIHDIPDIDMDIQDDRRHEAKEYLSEKWGQERVINICTFGTMGARGVLKDVARVYGINYNQMNAITKAILPDMTLKDAITIPEVESFVEDHPEIYKVAKRLEGQVRHIGGHAAGVVITPKRYSRYFHLVRSRDTLLSCVDMDDLKDLGLLKLDLLGSKNLRIFDLTERSIGNEEIRLDKVSYMNPTVYKAFRSGHTLGVFQFARWHFAKLLKAVKPTSIEDLAVVNALGRPGAKLTGQDNLYIHGKNGHGYSSKYRMPLLREILSPTFGAIIFQEQVMAICHKIGGLSLSETNDIRESIKHFDAKKMGSYEKQFKGHAINELGYDPDEVNGLWDDVKMHSGYSFNKSHAVAYSIMSYYSMYLKTLFPNEYMMALLNCADNAEELEMIVAECIRMGLEIRSPHIMRSGKKFSLGTNKQTGKRFIREGFISIRGIGDKKAGQLLQLRKEKNFPNNLTPGLRKVLLAGGTIGLGE